MVAYSPLNQTVLEGTNVTLHCNASGKPTPNITWTKDGSQAVLFLGDIYGFVNVQRQNAGDYTCTAWNGVGRQSNATATVNVQCESRYSFLLKSVLFCYFCAKSHIPQCNAFNYIIKLARTHDPFISNEHEREESANDRL